MVRHAYRIRVYGKQRKNIDPALLAQVVILLGRHLHQQRQHERSATGQTPPDKAIPATAHPGKPGRAQPEPSRRTRVLKKNEGSGADGAELL
jgi:hypothetical protein